MTQHTDLIERLRASSEDGLTPDDAYAAAEALEAQAREIAGLQAARMAYASEFPLDGEGEPDVGSIHQNIRAMKAEIERLRKDAALVAARERERCAQLCESMVVKTLPDNEWVDATNDAKERCAAAIRALNTEGDVNDPITG